MRPDLNHFSKPPRPPAVGDIAQQLRELPAETAPPYDWAEFRLRSRIRSLPKRQLIAWPHAAAAAGLAAFVAAMAMLGTATHSDVESRGDHGSAAVATTNGSDSSVGGQEVRGAADTAKVGAASSSQPGSSSQSAKTAASASKGPEVSRDPSEQARQAREWLARQPAEPAVVRAGPRLAVANLEDRIAWFDDTLTDERLRGASPDRLKVLQQERARLVASLAQVRYAEALMADGS